MASLAVAEAPLSLKLSQPDGSKVHEPIRVIARLRLRAPLGSAPAG